VSPSARELSEALAGVLGAGERALSLVGASLTPLLPLLRALAAGVSAPLAQPEAMERLAPPLPPEFAEELPALDAALRLTCLEDPP
jgi:hypothetical protein